MRISAYAKIARFKIQRHFMRRHDFRMIIGQYPTLFMNNSMHEITEDKLQNIKVLMLKGYKRVGTQKKFEFRVDSA